MNYPRNSNGRFIILCLLIVLLVTFQGITSTEEFKLQEATRPAKLQALINPGGNSGELTWLGADAATSVKITPDRYVWLFGDTILGKYKDGVRKYSVFIHNTIGVTKRDSQGNFTRIQKSYKKEDGKFRAIFTSQKSHIFYWPLVGTSLDSSLLVAASKVTTKDTKTFKILGTTFFTVENPMDPPEEWNYQGEFLPNEDGITWGNALVKQDEWVYVFGQKGKGLSSKTVLAKIRISDAKKGAWSKQLKFVDEKWKPSPPPDPIEGLPGTSETTIQYSPFFGWYCLQIPPFSFNIRLYTAERITGPWRDRGAVYTIPSPWSTEKTDGGKHVFSTYAAKSHPELAEEESEIVLTYNINLNPFVQGLTSKLGDYIGKKKYSELYIPQFVSLKFQKKSSD
ncbi:MAG: DUF4185 domain-containing protein [Candidatus Bipolaricaulota bacterium]